MSLTREKSQATSEDLKKRKCVLCAGDFQFLWKVGGHSRHVWNYESCNRCGWIRLAVDPSDRTWRKNAYPTSYYGDGYSKFSGAIQWLRELSARRRARELARFFSKPGRALDIGCGEGLFLESMKKLGWRVGGCETSGTAAQRTEERIGRPIHRGEFETMSAPPEPWDMVMLWHVLEHVSKPESLLRWIHAAMAANALLIVGVPNADSWQARLFGPHWFHLDPPRHLCSMRLSHLRRLAREAGFEEIEAHHFSLEYNPFGWAQSLLNAMGFKRDAMYEALKSQFQLSPGQRPRWSIRALAWFLLGPSIVPAIFEAAARRGGTVAVYFRKKE